MKRRSKKAVGQSTPAKVDNIFVKEDPDAADLEQSEKPEVFKAEISEKTTKSFKNRGIQVSLAEPECDVPVPGDKNGPIVSTEFVAPQCRFCLRQMSTDNLRRIANKQKSKANAAFKLKIYINDSYPYACVNCLNLIDILLDFKESVRRANYMLRTERTFIESDDWEEPDVITTIADCRAVVEQNRVRIDSIYEPKIKKSKPEMDPALVKDEIVIDESVSSSLANYVDPSEGDEFDGSLKANVFIEEYLQEAIPDEEETVPEVVEKIELDSDPELEPKREQMLDEEFNEDDDFNNGDDSEDADYEPTSLNRSKTDKRKSDQANDDASSSSDSDGEELKSAQKGKRKRSSRQSVTSGKKDYRVLCDFCGKKVHTTTAESHRNQHLGLKPYSCPQCPLKFHSSYNLSFHLRRAHEESDRRHECDICGSIIQGPASALKYHKKRHNQEKKHVCTICGKGFTMAGYLTQHVQAHGDFPHKCQYCGKRFNLRASMRTHEKNIHEKKMKMDFNQA